MRHELPEELALAHRVFALDPQNAPPPDWRWQLGGYLVQAKSLVPQERVDDWVRVAACLVRRRRPRRNRRDEAILQQFPGAIHALSIYEARAFRSWQIEARLLAGESFASIAQKCGTWPEVIEAYHELYYRVQPFLRSIGYIYTVAIPLRVFDNIARDDTEMLLKTFGYNFGPVFLDAVVDYFRQPPAVPARVDELDPGELEKLSVKVMIGGLIAIRTLPDDRKQMKWLTLLKKAASVFQSDGLNDTTADLICKAFGIPRAADAVQPASRGSALQNAEPAAPLTLGESRAARVA